VPRHILFVNPKASSRSPSPDEVAHAARARAIDVHVFQPGVDLGDVARAAGATAIGVAGGDGSLAPVAAAALERGVPFVCVPYGTRNHFARDLGLRRHDPLDALAAFVDRRERRIDVGRAGDRLFLNNVSLGVYAGLVHRRERHRRRGEALARARALLKVTRHRGGLRARANGEPIAARFLLVGNNHYELDLFTLGARDRLDEGKLHLWAAAGWLPRTWEERSAERFELELGTAHVRAAIDGEPALLESRLELESLPKALRVLLPGTTPQQSR
jgi:diacylglycerol kinase family enzyme